MIASAAALWLLPSVVHAGDKRRQVPDLRRDTRTWVEQRSVQHSIELPLVLHMATRRGRPLTTTTRIGRWVRRANEELRVANIHVTVREIRNLPSGWSSVTHWKQRRRLAHYAPLDDAIHVFVIEELDTERRRSIRRRIRGLHWRYRGVRRGMRDREYVMVTRGAPMTTLAHELGHLFGLGHSTGMNNVMCSCRSGADIRFDALQARRMHSGAETYIARRAVRRGRNRARRLRFREPRLARNR